MEVPLNLPLFVAAPVARRETSDSWSPTISGLSSSPAFRTGATQMPWQTPLGMQED